MAVSKRLRYEVLNRDGNACTKCGRKPPEVELQIDHVIPVALGGSDGPSNLQTLCKDCNSGKSSTPPDAPMVAQVSAQALAMADALAIVAEERAVSRGRARKLHQAFLAEWNEWSNWRGEPFDLPGSWKADINQFLNAGLHIDDLIELVDVTMSAKPKDKWKYFCGCCWNRQRQDVDRAAQIVAQNDPDAPVYLLPGSSWTQEDIEIDLYQTLERAKQFLTEEELAIPRCGHLDSGYCEGDLFCMVEYTVHVRWYTQTRRQAKERLARLDAEAEAVIDEAEALIDG